MNNEREVWFIRVDDTKILYKIFPEELEKYFKVVSNWRCMYQTTIEQLESPAPPYNNMRARGVFNDIKKIVDLTIETKPIIKFTLFKRYLIPDFKLKKDNLKDDYFELSSGIETIKYPKSDYNVVLENYKHYIESYYCMRKIWAVYKKEVIFEE